MLNHHHPAVKSILKSTDKNTIYVLFIDLNWLKEAVRPACRSLYWSKFCYFLQAVDDDAESPNNVIEYSIMTADPDNAFDITADTGEIRLKPYIKSMEIVQNITRQKDCKWSLVVQARDRGSPSFSTTAVVNIDITEAVRTDSLWLTRHLQRFLFHAWALDSTSCSS